MAVDMTNLTIAQYRQRIEKMSIKEIQKEIGFLETPGYNCEGLKHLLKRLHPFL